MQLSGKIALITGGGSGIGAAAGRYMAKQGAAVVLAGIPASGVQAIADEISSAGMRAMAIPTDVTSGKAVQAAVAAATDTFGGLDIVVANAGVQRHNTDVNLFEMDESEWDRTQDVNLRGVFRTCKYGLAQMIEQNRGGSVIIVSSITALNGRTPNVSYMTSKSGLLGMSRHIAVHYAKYGIRCNAVCPGALEQTPDWEDHPDPGGREEAMIGATPLGRLGTADDIAPWIAFLASDESGFATGGTFVVDGGITIA